MTNFDVIFINAPHHGPDYYSPIGIGLLQAILEGGGFRTHVLDFQRDVMEGKVPWPHGFFRAAEQQLETVSAPIFAFSVMNVGLPWAARIADACRRIHPESCIVFGGPHATLVGEELLSDFPMIDVIARREGEKVITPLTEALLAQDYEALHSVPNLIFRRDGALVHTIDAPFIEDLDELPLLKLDIDLLSAVEIISVEAGRGCPYHCTFCSSHSIWSRRPRFKSAKRLVHEGARFASAVPNRKSQLVVSFEHDDFLANRPWFLEFVSEKTKCEVAFQYGITARVNHITPPIADALAATGCVSVFMGLETGSQKLQKTSAKHLNLSDVLPRVKKLIDAGVHVSTNFIVGFPDETWDDLAESFEMMLAVKWAGADVNISVMCPEPGSALALQTPAESLVLLEDGPKCDELRRGGIDPALMKGSELKHLMTVRNDSFDIREVAALSRCMQLLMAEYPIALSALIKARDDDVMRLIRDLHAAQCNFGAVTHLTAFDFVVSVERRLPPATIELILYEHARASTKRGALPTIPLDAFRDQVHSDYLIARKALSKSETGPSRPCPPLVIPIYAMA